MNIGARLREIRKSKGVLQSHIEKQLSKPAGWLSRRESGGIEISASDLKNVSIVLNVPLDNFFYPVN